MKNVRKRTFRKRTYISIPQAYELTGGISSSKNASIVFFLSLSQILITILFVVFSSTEKPTTIRIVDSTLFTERFIILHFTFNEIVDVLS